MPRIPAPPLPRALRPKPKRPGDGNNQGALTPVEGAKTAADWVDERTSLSPMLRWTLFRKVPRGTNWAYTLGTATLFAFLSQAVTGVFLAMWYRPDATGGAYESMRYINDNVFAGQLVFQRETLFTRTLHHETAFSIQRRLQFAGIQVIILPIRVWQRQRTA